MALHTVVGSYTVPVAVYQTGRVRLEGDPVVTRERPPRLFGRPFAVLACFAAIAVATAGCSLLVGTPPIVRDRLPLPACGAEVVRNDGAWNAPGRRCLAAAGLEGAEFISTLHTIEGDPVTSIYRVLPNGAGAEVFYDSTHDVWSDRTWLHYTCPTLTFADVESSHPEIRLGQAPGYEEDCEQRSL
jgi:hypothetical protein